MSDPGQSFRFDRYALATARGLLLGPQGEIPLRPKSYQWLEESHRRIPANAAAEYDLLQQTSSSSFLGPLHDDPRWAALFDDDSAWISAKTR